ncbi:MAG: 3-isopropylmalate dehydratase large subunit [Gammaproteobacteria bacterium]|nr:3-isopropylmalate dehydratase large subunit [Gammaproteobacteria bacterium]
MSESKTLYDKLWEQHLVTDNDDGSSLIYINRHLIHEVTSPQAFEGLRLANRNLWRVNANLATPDHNVPTTDRGKGIADPISKLQVDTLDQNCDNFGVQEFKMSDIRQGIVHVVGPEQGAILPGMTVVCGDSHTSTHGALGCLAFGIGTSEVEHVMATQCLVQKKSKNMLVEVTGKLSSGVTAKDVVLSVIGKIGTAGGTGYAIEFAGDVISDLSIEGRMTMSNMAIEAGARAGMMAVDDKTIEYIRGKDFAPSGDILESAIEHWETLKSDEGAVFDAHIVIEGESIKPQVTWGTSPEMTIAIDELIPDPDNENDEVKKTSIINALKYMGLEANQAINSVSVDVVFIGSCTNSRIEDLRAAAKVAEGKQVADSIKQAIVVPGSGLVKQQAEQEGLDQVFIKAGFEWREPGCSMCLAMNADKLEAGERCASTSNRNFEGRQGQGGRTHLVSPAMAAAAAVTGHFVDVNQI